MRVDIRSCVNRWISLFFHCLFKCIDTIH